MEKKKLRKLVDIEEEEEEEEVYVSLIRKNKDADDSAQKGVIEPTLKVAQLLASIILNQFEKHLCLRIKKLLLVFRNLLRFRLMKL